MSKKKELQPEKVGKTEHVTIPAPNMKVASFHIVGDAPLVMHKMSQKTKDRMREDMEAKNPAEKARLKKERRAKPRNFDEDYEGSKHITKEGWLGIPAPAFRRAWRFSGLCPCQ